MHIGTSFYRRTIRWAMAVAIGCAGVYHLSPSLASEIHPPASQHDLFLDIAQKASLHFVHFNGMSGEFYFPEMTGQGGALLDYDNDGDLDIYFVQGAMLGPGKTLDDALFPPEGPLPPGDRLYRNDSWLDDQGNLVLHFVDVTEESRIRALGYGMGVATGDYNRDGWVDLYVTNYGPNQLLRNNGDGTFTDVTAEAGTDDPRWSTSATFLDFDRDGWPDLFVVNYVDFSVERNPRCFAPSSRRDYCGPADFRPLPDSLFRNRGDGTFENVTTRALAPHAPGAGLGVAAADVNGDGWPDLYVANDGHPNHLWLNRRDGTFQEEGLLAGAAVNRQGVPEASMGVDAGDFDADGDDDLFMTHLARETNTLFVNDGTGMFEDRTVETGLGPPSLPFTGFGTAWLDYDGDGWLDLLVVNGAVRIQEPLALAGDPYPLSQTNQLFRNLQGERFEEVTETAGEIFRLAEVSRGAAFGDVDNDGDPDVLVLNNNGPARLLLNTRGNRRPWLGWRLRDRETAGDMVGVRVEVLRLQAPTLWRRSRTDGSYASAHDPRVLVGLGEPGPATEVVLHWPDGSIQRWNRPPQDRYLVVEDPPAGRGERAPSP